MSKAGIRDTGLSAVYEPQPTALILVDIIFVHGLQGHPYKTWATKRMAAATEPSRDENEQDTFRKRALRRIIPIRSSSAAAASRDGSINSKRRWLGGRKSVGESPDGDEGVKGENTGLGINTLNSLGESLRPGASDTPGDSPSAVFWPSDLLPTESPNARILTWGYDTMVTKYMTGPTNKNSIFSHAKDLLFALGRDRPVGRRIIFVAHSLGGIVVKEMLSESSLSREPRLKDIIESTAAVVFLGTPHRGSADMANLGDIVGRVAAKVLRMDTSHAPLQALGLHSAELERCQDAFSRLWATYDFRVKTFQEGFALTGFNIGALGEKVVPDYSSLLGNTNEHAETLQANHMEMCRFKGPSDPNYLKVSNELRDMYLSLQIAEKEATPQKSGAQKDTTDPHVLDKTSEACLASLAFPEMYRRKASINPPAENTCAWLLGHEVFRSWLDRTDVDKYDGLLWIKGKPGSGKSTIMKAISEKVSRQARHDNLSVATFYFNAKGTELERSRLGLLRSLLYQLVRVNTQYLKRVVKLYQERLQEMVPYQDVEWQTWELETHLSLIFQQSSCNPTVIFVDALDECDDGDARDVAVFLRQLRSSAHVVGAALNICISSRHFPSITIRDSAEITMEQFNQPDMGLFIRSKFAASDILEDQQSATLEQEIVEKSSGIFLWVVLVVDMLLKYTEDGKGMTFLCRRLRDVPEELETLFTTLLTESHEDTLTTIRLFQWAVLSPVPLRLREWHHILAFIRRSGAPRSLDEWRTSEYFTEDDDQLERQLRSISKGLLEVGQNSEGKLPSQILPPPSDKDSVQAGAGSLEAGMGETRVVQLIHESVRQFFLNGDGFALIDRSRSWTVGDGHLAIMDTCLSYIRISELDALVEARKELRPKTHRPLSARSSVSSFGSAGSDMASTPPNEEEMVNGISNPRLTMDDRYSWGSMMSPYVVPPIMDDVRTSPSFIRPLPEQVVPNYDWSASASINSLFEPVTAGDEPTAASRRSRPTSPGPSINDSLESSWGAPSQVLQDFPALLHYSTHMMFVHARLAESHGCDPITVVHHLSSIWLRYLLLRENLPRTTNLFVYAAKLGLVSWLPYVFKPDLEIMDFAMLIFKRDPDVMSIVLLQDINWSGKRPPHGTLMHKLAHSSRHYLWQQQHIGNLLKTGKISRHALRSYLNTFDQSGLTPLLISCSRLDRLCDYNYNIAMTSDCAVVELLISNGADVNAKNRASATPLHKAVRYSSDCAVVELLISNGADVNAKDWASMTPLHEAVRYSSDYAVVELLISNGADVNAKDSRGRTPLIVAMEGHITHAVVQLLLENGTAVTSDMVLEMASNSSSRDCWSINTAAVPASLLDLVLEHGGDVHAVGPYLQTPLHLAASRGCVEMVEVILRRGGNPRAVDKGGHTPLHLACSVSLYIGPGLSRVEIIKTLLAAGADLCAKNENGRTPLDISDGSLGDILTSQGILRHDEVQAAMTRKL